MARNAVYIISLSVAAIHAWHHRLSERGKKRSVHDQRGGNVRVASYRLRNLVSVAKDAQYTCGKSRNSNWERHAKGVITVRRTLDISEEGVRHGEASLQHFLSASFVTP